MVSDTRGLFESHGIRCTRQRVELYDTLAACECHPTAEQLHRMVLERTPGTSLATVYNTLEAFTSAGLCRKLAAAGGGARYDADLSHHLHLTTPDGRVFDVPDEVGQEVVDAITPDMVARIEKALGVSIDHIELQIRTK
jgi:Fe2+ or Zn2+ uptake regulation protein